MSALIPSEFIKTILGKIDIVEFIDARVPLKRTGRHYVACCPFHQEKTPSFSVNREKQFFHCFGCGEHGDIIAFVMQYDRLNFVEAIESLANQLGLSIPATKTGNVTDKNSFDFYSLMQKVMLFYQGQLKKSPQALQYLRERAINEETAQRYALGFAPDNWHALAHYFAMSHPQYEKALNALGLEKYGKNNKSYDVFRHRLIFPIRDPRGRAIGFGGRGLEAETVPKYLNSPESALFHKSSTIYGLYEVLQVNRHLSYLLIVEGYIDVLMLAQHGITQTVACMGTAITGNHLKRLLTYTDTLIFCFDGDDAGKKAAWRTVEHILPLLQDGLTIKFVLLPEKTDPDDFIKKSGKNEFELLLKQARLFSHFFWETLEKDLQLQHIEDRAKLQKRAESLLNKMQNSALKKLMLEALEQKTGVAQKKIIPVNENISSKVLEMSEQPQAIDLAFALLLQDPKLASILTQHSLMRLPFHQANLFKALLHLFKAQPDLTLAQCLRFFQDKENSLAMLQKAAKIELEIPLSAYKVFFSDLLDKIEAEIYIKIENHLYHAIKQAPDNAALKNLFVQLQQKKQNILPEGMQADFFKHLLHYCAAAKEPK